MLHMYQNKDRNYFGSERREILPLLPMHCGRLLEVGCGEGATIAWIKSLGRATESWGVEIEESAASVAREIVDHITVGDIESPRISFDENQFDVILCLDVLEHLRDPWAVMALLGRWLRRGGTFIASIPNIRYYTVLRDLVLDGSFRYTDSGILDRTHLRFFTRESGIELMKAGGFERVDVVLHPEKLQGTRRLINLITLDKFRDTFSWQLLLRASKPELTKE